VATRYLALLGSDRDAVLHLVREDAEASLCGAPRSTLSPRGHIDGVMVCRDCIDWVPRRWTGTQPKAQRT
jgi:hypothetical protein